jgi:hypothetical protein
MVLWPEVHVGTCLFASAWHLGSKIDLRSLALIYMDPRGGEGQYRGGRADLQVRRVFALVLRTFGSALSRSIESRATQEHS